MDWKNRIERAKKNGCFSNDDIHKASNWSSCAISELDSDLNSRLVVLSKNKFYIDILSDLGMDFFLSVKAQYIARAEEIYNKFENLFYTDTDSFFVKIHSEYDSIKGDVNE